MDGVPNGINDANNYNEYLCIYVRITLTNETTLISIVLAWYENLFYIVRDVKHFGKYI